MEMSSNSSKSEKGGVITGKNVISFAIGAAAAALSIVINHVVMKPRKRTRVVGVLPARYASTRFPGKPLIDIAGKPMIIRTYEQACKAKTLDAVVVATDDDRIADVCRAAGALVVMTDPDCPNGTERCNEAVKSLGGRYDIVINIQGDEPLIDPDTIDDVVQALKDSPDAVYSTAATPLGHDEVSLRQRVKVVRDCNGYAIYFSRGVIPHNKDGTIKPYPPPFEEKPYLLHLGIQAYDRDFLDVYASLPATPLQLMEDLEQLKVMEHGYRMKVVVVDHSAHGVDMPEDVASIEAKIRDSGGLYD